MIDVSKAEVGAYYAANLGLVHSIAKKCFWRLQSIGAAMAYEDVVQELSLVFLRSYELHDEAKGSKFSTYFTYAAYNRINKIAEGYETERIRFGTKSVEELDSFDEEGGCYDLLACDRMNPEETLVAKRLSSEIRDKLSPLASLVVEWLVNPPDFVTDELEKELAHTRYAKDLGFNKRLTSKLTISYICDMVCMVSDVSKSEAVVAKRELKSVIENYGQTC